MFETEFVVKKGLDSLTGGLLLWRCWGRYKLWWSGAIGTSFDPLGLWGAIQKQREHQGLFEQFGKAQRIHNVC